jgi:hypothetical protein
VTPKVKLLPHVDIPGKAKTNGITPTDHGSVVVVAPKPKKGRPPKTEKAMVKAQTGGMSPYDLRACRNAMKKYTTNAHAVVFLQPVDPVRDAAPKCVYNGVILLFC